MITFAQHTHILRYFLLITLAFLCVSLTESLGQTSSNTERMPQQALDTFHMKNGKKLKVQFVRMEGDSIYYCLPGAKSTYRMTRNRVLRIHLANGEEKELQKSPASNVNKPVRWQDITVTQEKKDIRGMRLLDKYDEKLGSKPILNRHNIVWDLRNKTDLSPPRNCGM